jgi:hypothetical protein
MEKQQEQKKGFDIRVTHRDERTGLIVERNPYKLHVIGNADGTKMKLWERPVGSGNLWNFKNEPIGRLVKGAWEKDAKHIEFTPPQTQDQKLAHDLIAKDAKIAEMEKELAAIRAEQEKKDAGSKKPAATSEKTGA